MIKTSIILLLLPFLLFLVLSENLHAQKHGIKFERITIEQGLSQNSGLCIVQDQKGFMWFGTWDGLNKYDGYSFIVYSHDPEDPHSLSHNSVWAIYEDVSGKFWIGTWGGGLNTFDREQGIFVRYKAEPENLQSLSSNLVRTIYEDSSGTLWIGTHGGGLNTFNRATETFTQ